MKQGMGKKQIMSKAEKLLAKIHESFQKGGKKRTEGDKKKKFGEIINRNENHSVMMGVARVILQSHPYIRKNHRVDPL